MTEHSKKVEQPSDLPAVEQDRPAGHFLGSFGHDHLWRDRNEHERSSLKGRSFVALAAESIIVYAIVRRVGKPLWGRTPK